MKCARCNRPLTKAAMQYGKNWLGPKCAEKMHGKPGRRVRVEVVESVGQMDLFVVGPLTLRATET